MQKLASWQSIWDSNHSNALYCLKSSGALDSRLKHLSYARPEFNLILYGLFAKKVQKLNGFLDFLLQIFAGGLVTTLLVSDMLW